MGNFISQVLREQHDAATEWVAISPLNDTAKQLLARFVAAGAGNADPKLVNDLLHSPDAQLDHRLVIWLVSRLGDYDAAMTYIESRLDNGYHVDPRPMWGAGISLYEHERFPLLVQRLGLVEYWAATDWGSVCRLVDDALICDGFGLTPDALNAILEENH